jgi:hypothetical protein
LCGEDEAAALVDLNLANELDVFGHDPSMASAHGGDLLRLLASARHRLFAAALEALTA